MTDLEQHRQAKDEFMKEHPYSPLSPELQRDFTGLKYFPENPALRVEVQVEPFPKRDTITMQTSTGDTQKYQRWGQFSFEVENQPARLTVYYSDRGGFFVPFRDATSGTETYGSGRYMEIEPLRDGKFQVDFNLAYNPYCAYSPDYSCPIPPPENWLKVPIQAGEMDYGAH